MCLFLYIIWGTERGQATNTVQIGRGCSPLSCIHSLHCIVTLTCSYRPYSSSAPSPKLLILYTFALIHCYTNTRALYLFRLLYFLYHFFEQYISIIFFLLLVSSRSGP